MQKVVWISCVFGLVLVGAIALNSDNQAQARPAYLKKGFKKKYTNLAAAAKKAGCLVCHGKKKKIRNDYGMAVGKMLGKKKVKVVEEIMQALTKAEKEKNAKGETFGSLIKAGKLPGTPVK